MKKYILILTLLVSILLVDSVQGQNYRPYAIGYLVSNPIPLMQDTSITMSGGIMASLPNTVFNIGGNGTPVNWSQGFKPNIQYLDPTFNQNKELFVSKGFFADYVELKWEIENYESLITRIKVYRKELGTTNDSVVVASLSKDQRTWQDTEAEMNVYYKYYVHAEGIIPYWSKYFNYVDGIGFRLASARLSGNVAYATGGPVKGVKITAETNDDLGLSCVKLKGNVNSFLEIEPLSQPENFKLDKELTIQAWLLPEGNSGTFFQKGNQYLIDYTSDATNYTLSCKINGVLANSLVFPKNVGQFFHLAITKDLSNVFQLYAKYDDDTTYASTPSSPIIPASNLANILLGKKNNDTSFYTGYIEEVRIWLKALTKEQIEANYGGYLSGEEEGMLAYYRLDEKQGEKFYDLSKTGTSFNEHHGDYGSDLLIAQNNVPLELKFKAITDDVGSYQIAGIPYRSGGSSYTIRPIGTHQYEPQQIQRYLGPGATNVQGVDFDDISAFTVTGSVFYQNTDVPVKGVKILIDNEIALQENGNAVTTDATGLFSVSVSIGLHHISLEKEGHGFHKTLGRFPEQGKFNFVEGKALSRLIDTTLVKVVGRFVGGPEQAGKPVIFGRSINNLGQGEIKLSSPGGNLNTSSVAPVIIENEIYTEDENGVAIVSKGQSNVEITADEVIIKPDATTGEFTAFLLPEIYSINVNPTAGLGVQKYTMDELQYTKLVDLTGNKVFQTVTDTNIVGKNAFVDSLKFQHRMDFIYRVTPSITVKNKKDGSPIFWEREIYTNGDTVPLYDENDNLINYGAGVNQYPIFNHYQKYEVIAKVSEVYLNVDNTAIRDTVPVTDGVIRFNNDLALHGKIEVINLDDKGEAIYDFYGGAPNLTVPFTQSINITAETGKNGAIKTAWDYNGSLGQPSPIDGLIGISFGAIGSGTNFVTDGPSMVTMIVRDPPGSNSYAWYETGQTITNSTSYESVKTLGFQESVHISLGPDLTFGTGVGFVKETEIDVVADVEAGIELSSSITSSNTVETTTTNTKRWETSSDPLYVGGMGDVFIGNSTNISYGVATNLNFKEVLLSNCSGDCFTINKNGTDKHYKIDKVKNLSINPTFKTSFQYTQNHIENYLIPNIKLLRDNFLEKHLVGIYNWYEIKNPSTYEGESNNEDLTTFSSSGNLRIYDGDQYKITLDLSSNWHPDSTFVDSVKVYNSKIESWEQVLALNEKAKIESNQVEDNLSFDAGTVYSSELTTDTTFSFSGQHTLGIDASIAASLGAYVDGVGGSVTVGFNYGIEQTNALGIDINNSKTFGYELADSDQGDYFTLDVIKPNDGYSAIFKLKGGQSSCPYEGEEKTNYQESNEAINDATELRENPKISALSREKLDVPEDKPAFFDCHLSNQVSTGDGGWFQISIDQESNTEGALIKLDGAPVGDGKVVFIPGGEGFNKVISIEKNKPDVFEFENIGIILHSICQFDPADNWDDISDTLLLTAKFIPVCTNVSITKPSDNWTAIKKDIGENGQLLLDISISEFDVLHAGFNKILFEVSPAFSSNWVEHHVFYKDSADIDVQADTTKHKWIGTHSKLDFKFNITELADREYKLRARSVCGVAPNLIVNNSNELRGIKDTQLPKLFGTPQPGDGILSVGEDVRINFNEEIVPGALNSAVNFSVKGIKNGGQTTHSAALYFDGLSNKGYVQSPVSIEDKDFTYEFWIKRASIGNDGAGNILKQGEFEIGFNTNDELEIKAGDASTTGGTFNFTDKWIHFSVVYSHDDSTIQAYAFHQGLNTNLLINPALKVVNGFASEGVLNIGFGSSGYFNGFIHGIRMWEKSLTEGEASSKQHINLNGDEIKLSGLWPLEDLSGNVAEDKSRAHHLVLDGAQWRAFPIGFSKVFDGANAIIMPFYSFALDEETDFTIELWFKGDQSNRGKILFSNGNEGNPEIETWEIGFNSNSGNIYVQNNGTTITSSAESNVLDSHWHHMALVVKRTGNATLYIDGNTQKFENASLFGPFKVGNVTLGASGDNLGGNLKNHFNGRVDEFRVWQLARTSKLLELDRFSKLRGDEIGLVAYYPFDSYNSSQILEGTNESQLVGDSSQYAEIGMPTLTFDNNDAANVKDARPVENLQFSHVANTESIIINIDEAGFQIEKQIVEFSVQGVEDVVGNNLASPITWTAYIKQNPVLWSENSLFFEKEVYKPLSFEVEILNKGGTEEVYNIGNLPNWLSISEQTGSLGPDSRKTIQFHINSGISIGMHEVALYLSTDFGFNEVLLINLKVVGHEPDWNVIPAQFQNSMSIVGQIKIGDVISTDSDDKLVALVNGEVRGVANLQYLSQYDQYILFMDVYSNESGGEDIDFQIWDASEGRIQTDVSTAEPMIFAKNAVHGNPGSPILFTAINNLLEPIVINQGFNWLSFPLSSSMNSDLGEMFEGVAVEGMKIRTRNGPEIGTPKFAAYSNGVWDNAVQIQNGWMYMLDSPVNDTLPYVGGKLDPSMVQVDIPKNYWVWVGTPLLSNIPLSDAFSNFTLEENDLIKGQSGFAMYDPNGGWMGTLEYLQPKAGYMFKSASNVDRTLVFPAYQVKNGKLHSDELVNLYEQHAFNYKKFSGNASLIATVDVCEGRNEDYQIACYYQGELRGISPIKNGKFFVTLYGDQPNEELHFKLMDSYGKTYELNESVVYQKEAMVGTTSMPFKFTSKSALYEPFDENTITVSPSVYQDMLHINYYLTEDTSVLIELYDVTGKFLQNIMDVEQTKGSHNHTWLVSLSNKELPAGVHLLKVKLGNTTPKTFKLIKTN